MGTTSAHAENTRSTAAGAGSAWNYLRARGEYMMMCGSSGKPAELPPRTRRIHTCAKACIIKGGTTSAHAENTLIGGYPIGNHENYLRARGEYGPASTWVDARPELPPRTRRIHNILQQNVIPIGTTSAHAENTLNELGLL